MRIWSLIVFATLGVLVGCGDAPPHGLMACKTSDDCPADWFCLDDQFCHENPGALTGQGGTQASPTGTGPDGGLDASFNDGSTHDASGLAADAGVMDASSAGFLDGAIDGAIDGSFESANPKLSVVLDGVGRVIVTESDTDLECDSNCAPRYPAGAEVTLTAVPPIGTTFEGWSGACSGTEPTCTLVITAATRVKAAFEPILHTITITKQGPGGGTVTAGGADISCGATCNATVAYGTEVTLTGAPNGSSLFGGWGAGTCAGVAPCTFMITGDVQVSATFPLDSFTLVVSRSGNGSGSVSSSPAGISCGADCTESYSANQTIALSAAAAAGSTFTGWSGGGCSGTGSCSVTLDTSKTVMATFTLQRFAFSVVRSGTGSGNVTSQPAAIDCGSTCSSTQNYGSQLTLTAAAASNSSFTGWSGGGCSGTGTCSVTISAASSVTATFTLRTFVLSAANSGNGAGRVTSGDGKINCSPTCSATYDSGQTATLSATPATGSTFAGWSGSGCSGTGSCIVSMTAIRNVVASFTLRRYALQVSKTGTGVGTVTSGDGSLACGSTCAPSYDHGTRVTLSATPDANSTFAGWSGAGCSGTGTCTVDVTALVNVSAAFTLRRLSLRITRAGSGSSSGHVGSTDQQLDCGTACSATYDYGSSVTLAASVSQLATFGGWSGGGCAGTGSCVVNLVADTAVTASFTALPNYAFVSTGVMSGADGVAVADAYCKAEAARAGLPGTFVAWLSSDGASGFSAVSRLGQARGWIRPDGEPVADRASDLVNATPSDLHTFYPIRLTAAGVDVGHTAVFTGTGYDGRSASTSTSATCSSWSSIAAGGAIGYTSATGLDFTSFSISGCRVQHPVYCFGTDNASPLSFKAVSGRRAFVTRRAFIPTNGRDGADKLCQDEAADAGVTGSFLALLATAEQSAAARFDTQGATWVRMDGVPLAKSAAQALARATTLWDAPLNIAADGGELFDQRVWSGTPDVQGSANPLSAPGGNQDTTCNDWVSNKNTASAGRIGDSFLPSAFGVLGQQPCSSTGLALACLEK